MNISSTHHIQPELAALEDDFLRVQMEDFAEIGTLAKRFRQAHAKLNEIELQLQDGFTSASHLILLNTLEEARVEYSDARFALSTRNAISNKC